jgi:anthranilate synthase component 1
MLIKKTPDAALFKELSEHYNVIPVFAEVLADTETPVSLLKKFFYDGPVFLLESVEGGERWGRYSFLGTSARKQIRVYRETVVIQENGTSETIRHEGNPLSVLRSIMDDYRPANTPDLPRFWGGMVGYLTYEAVSFFEEIPHDWPADSPLAHFVIPDELLIFDNIRNTLLCVVITFPDDHREGADAVYNQALERLGAMLAKMEKPLPEPPPAVTGTELRLTPQISDASFRANVQKTKDYIRAGDIIQAVISQPFVCDSPPDLWSLYRAQRYINPSPYLYFMQLDETVLVGSSPETMVRLEGGVATLRPIAGTRPRGKNEQEDRALADELLKDEKERAEHLMLVDLGRNDLGRIARIGTVQVTDLMTVERYSHVMHLVSNICCDIEPEKDAWDLLAATFPAGTLSGAPKIRAMEIISELETEPRGPYGGAVGYISFSGNMDLAITIRTATVQQGRLTVRAGAGIVADSDPETERVETVNKAMAIQRALEMVEKSSQTEGAAHDRDDR